MNKFVFVGEQKLVARSASKDGSRLSEEGGLEDFRGVFGDAIEDEFFRVAFPAGGEEFKAFTNHRPTNLARREIGASEVGSMLVEEQVKSDGD